MTHQPSPNRYDTMLYRRCGHSGLKLPAVSLGLYHNFGAAYPEENGRAMVLRAFDLGITHFDLANDYGPPPGTAEETLGRILRRDLAGYRDELVISSKAGYQMWPGPYGNWGSRKYLMASLDQSLRRLGLDYLDIFYSHRPDPETPIEETMGALHDMVRQGKVLYAGISSYEAGETRRALDALRRLGTPLLIHQPSYSMFDRWTEDGLLALLSEEGVGCIAFQPLAQGLLTNRYLNGIPADSRAVDPNGDFPASEVTDAALAKARLLDDMARQRGQTLAQMAIAWVLRQPGMTSVVAGASRVSQVEDNVGALGGLAFSREELARIETILAS